MRLEDPVGLTCHGPCPTSLMTHVKVTVFSSLLWAPRRGFNLLLNQYSWEAQSHRRENGRPLHDYWLMNLFKYNSFSSHFNGMLTLDACHWDGIHKLLRLWEIEAASKPVTGGLDLSGVLVLELNWPLTLSCQSVGFSDQLWSINQQPIDWTIE